MPTLSKSIDKEVEVVYQRKEQEIMVKLTELLLSEQLISPEEKNRLSIMIQKGWCS